MDIGAPNKLLARVDVSQLNAILSKYTDEDWRARPVRNACLAGGPHAKADSIVLRHEWTANTSKRGYQTITESILAWGERSKVDSTPMLPFSCEHNSECAIYTFPDWMRWQALVQPAIHATIGAISAQPRGVLTRALFVRLPAGAEVPQHRDEQDTAKKAHRVHVCISDNPDCRYTIGDHTFTMRPGEIYDFNNCWEHSVQNTGNTPRINLMLEYLPNPDWIDPAPMVFERKFQPAPIRPQAL